MSEKYVAYYSAECEYETFETFKEAEKWLQEWDQQDGISEETEQGLNFIAKITHISKVKKVETKEEYIKRNGSWDFSDDWDWLGEVEYMEVEE
jgi:hypothetical protein